VICVGGTPNSTLPGWAGHGGILFFSLCFVMWHLQNSKSTARTRALFCALFCTIWLSWALLSSLGELYLFYYLLNTLEVEIFASKGCLCKLKAFETVEGGGWWNSVVSVGRLFW